MEARKSKVVYIAGPYRAYSEDGKPIINQIYRNIDRARWAAEELAAAGIFFLCPHLNSGLMDGAADDEFFLEMGLELLARCDAILLIGNWRGSDGSCMEREMAATMEIPIFEDIRKLKKAIKNG
ncbi:MAG: DUF4406 domain-containing protein [Candidatus Aminicenantes bacterium]|nr:DUF4406 domain-containing protein [Candidatus Aminicenantes bacterium]NIQ70809.1 DUF4406 domain-containing protein [Candidatus Aminicenantes bacterium]NIT26854.1 DUF4406 domain-containing protein [Candidatus Aminicenantes bacterium]